MLIVVVPAGHDHSQSVERQRAGDTPRDLPRQGELAHAVGRTTSGATVYTPTGADGITVARFEVAAGHLPRLDDNRHRSIYTKK